MRLCILIFAYHFLDVQDISLNAKRQGAKQQDCDLVKKLRGMDIDRGVATGMF